MNFFPAEVESVAGGEARLSGAAMAPLVLPADGLAKGAKLTVGVRPEHLTLADEEGFAAEGVVELVERLGEASFAYVRRADDKMMVVEVRGRETPEPGRTATFRAPARELHLFDTEGRRIKGAG